MGLANTLRVELTWPCPFNTDRSRAAQVGNQVVRRGEHKLNPMSEVNRLCWLERSGSADGTGHPTSR
jgi:hypothetical protein